MTLLNHYLSEELQEVLDWINTPLSPIKTGFCRKINPPGPEWWIATFGLGNNPIGLFHTRRVAASAGTSIHVEEALTKALGEALERYSSINSHLNDDLVEMPVEYDTGFRFARCADFEPTQPSFKPGGIIEQPIDHSRVTRLTTGSQHWIPAEHVHLGYVRYDQRLMHTSPISTGCAFYYDLTTAIWKGICEYIERDAMMRFWHLRLPARRIKLEGVRDYELRTRVRRLRKAGIGLKLFEISHAVDLPTCYAVLTSDVFPYYCIGASTHADVVKAACKAIDECVSIRQMAEWNGFEQLDQADLLDFSRVNNLEAHMGLYANWKDSPAFDFFLDCSEEYTLEEVAESRDWLPAPRTHAELVDVARRIEALGFTILWKDVSIPETAKYGNTVKVVIPEMIPLSQQFSARWLHSLLPGRTPESINPFPHPFS